MTLRRFHGLSALLLAAYACIHIINHLVGLAGVEAHIAFMRSFRAVYRIPIVEMALFAAVAFQIYSGLYFIVRGWKKRQGLVA
jgi:succinate dehydrogenase/fumarate reductase cytochrome b subunit